MKYAEESVRKNIMRKPSVPGPPEYADSSFIGKTFYTQEIEATRWIELEKIYPMLSAYSSWYQGPPFNDFFDYRYEYLVFGHKDKAPAGCVPLSVAKIFTKFAKPREIEYRKIKVNLDDLNTDLSLMTDLQKKSAAALLRYIADQCGSLQFYEGTFTFPLFARLLMERKGYNNVISRHI